MPIRELKAKLSEFLRVAAQGEEVIVTLHKRPIAKIVPVGKSTESEREAIARLNALPWIRAGEGGAPHGGRSLARVVADGMPVSHLLTQLGRTKR